MIGPGGDERHGREPRTYRKHSRSGLRRAAAEDQADLPVAGGGTPRISPGARRWPTKAGAWLVAKIQVLTLIALLVYAAGVFVASGIAEWKYSERHGLEFVRTVPESQILAEGLLWPFIVALWLFDVAQDGFRETPVAPAQPRQESTPETTSSIDPNG